MGYYTTLWISPPTLIEGARGRAYGGRGPAGLASQAFAAFAAPHLAAAPCCARHFAFAAFAASQPLV